MAQYRYSVSRFRQTLITAAAMTAGLAGLVWMLLTGLRDPDAGLWALASGSVFFAFVSVSMLWRYYRNGVVLAVQPAGLYDARVSEVPVSWEDIRDIVLRQAEDAFRLDVYLWKRQEAATAVPDFSIDLDSLNAGAGEIVNDIAAHSKIRNEAGIALGHALQ